MSERMFTMRPDALRTRIRTIGAGLGLSALALVGATVDQTESFAPNQIEPTITADADIVTGNTALLSFEGAIANQQSTLALAAALAEDRRNVAASRVAKRKAIAEKKLCWDGDASDFNSTEKEYYKYIYRACELAEGQPWADEDFSAQMDALISLWDRESGWNPRSDNPNSSAYGIPQALPGSKMGKGWQKDPDVQIKWGLKYVTQRYGTPINAWQTFLDQGWY